MPDPDKRVQYRGTGFYLGLVAILVFALALLVLAVQNTQEVDVEFFGFVFTVPLFAVAIGAAILAVVLDGLIGLVWRRQRRTRLEERAELDRLRAADAALPEEPGESGDRERERPVQAPPSNLGDERRQPAEDHDDTPPGNTPTP